jgi:phosphoserine phosphatase
MKKILPFMFLAFFAWSCSNAPEGQDSSFTKEILKSWNDGQSKKAIIDFVITVTDKNSKSFVPEADRIAVFDNDGTLWAEQPMYFQLYFILDEIKKMAPDHPEWKEDQLFNAVLENDLQTIMESGVPGLLKLAMAAQSGMPVEEFEAEVKAWIETAKHPETGKRFMDMTYKPMVELLDYLRENGFKTYIVSGGGIDFMRPWTAQTYGIPPEQVIGSMSKYSFINVDGKPEVVKLPEMAFIDDKEGKPVGIWKFIGKRPIAAFGNSDGDLAMMQWTAAGTGERLSVFISHDDAEREWSYGRDSHIGKLDKGMDEAKAKGWPVVSMKNDWKIVFDK